MPGKLIFGNGVSDLGVEINNEIAGARSAGRPAERPGSPWLARSGLDWLDLLALDVLACSIWLSWSLRGALASAIWLPWTLPGINFAAHVVKVALNAMISWPCALLGALAASFLLLWMLLGSLAGSIWLPWSLLRTLAGLI